MSSVLRRNEGVHSDRALLDPEVARRLGDLTCSSHAVRVGGVGVERCCRIVVTDGTEDSLLLVACQSNHLLGEEPCMNGWIFSYGQGVPTRRSKREAEACGTPGGGPLNPRSTPLSAPGRKRMAEQPSA